MMINLSTNKIKKIKNSKAAKVSIETCLHNIEYPQHTKRNKSFFFQWSAKKHICNFKVAFLHLNMYPPQIS